MHEMSLAQSIVEIVENTAEANNTRKVSKVKLIVGELAGVEMHALMQGLKIASQETPMEGAEIEIERPQGTAWCMMCQKTVPLHRRGDACPECGSYQLSINGGTEFRVSELELGDDE
ncbi:hydrogenase maturation nickel metallochaperone HypA [Parasutterella muris]|jgi:hydrogenase nickel insertion protein HypA|uniref:Hydrogenase maturation factor HypA n=1 Tax=Parasutterella muris TaxID=2565572 RepID=A0A6L6YEG6_9BURK|nr:hydrogenase maturation nickel metallochaperone HypA [Parasutterella muris]MVX55966.1 hydrogenase maturation nickel metallochaperone HypA [Parasutterella muris]